MRNRIFAFELFIGSIIFTGCGEKIKQKSEFRSIEYSSYGQLGHSSIKIDSAGTFFFQKSFRRAEDTCYTGKLPDSILVKINNIVSEIKKTHLDTLYSIDYCMDCGSYCYIIDADSFHLKTTVRGRETDILLLRLNAIVSKSAFNESKMEKIKVDTTIVFKSSLVPTLRVLQDSSDLK